MPEPDIIPISASIASTGKGIRYIGTGNRQYTYAYSGSIIVNNNTVTALEFTTGAGVCSVLFYHSGLFAYMSSSKTLQMRITFNGEVVIFTSRLTAATNSMVDIDPIPAIIPPLTNVKVEVLSDMAGNIEHFISMTGRVYGAV